MTKLRNKIMLVLLALCIVACLGLAVACGDDTTDDATVEYTVTVTAGGVAAEGVQVTVKNGPVSYKPEKTDKNGKAVFKLTADDGYTVTLADLPDGYSEPEGMAHEFGANRKLVIDLTASFAYKIKLVNPDGSAFTADGVAVGICTLGVNSNCLNPVALDAQGVASVYNAEKTDYHIQILGLPEGYAYEGYAYESDEYKYAMRKNAAGSYVTDNSENIYVELSATTTEATVTIYKVEQIDLAKETPLTAAQIAATDLNINGDKAYKYEAKLGAGDTEYYSFTPEYDGEYIIYALDNAAYKLNEAFLLGDAYVSGSGYFNKGGHYLTARAGETYYLNITNNGNAEATAQFIITTPAASKVVLENPTTVKAVVNKSGANALVALAPDVVGSSYSLTLKGTGAIKQVGRESDAETLTFVAADYKENNSCTVKFTEDMAGQRLYFAVSVKAENYPASINVEVKKGNALKNETIVVTATETLAKYARPAGKELVPMPLDGSVKLVLGSDKYYHVGDANGPVVVVNLTENLDEERFSAGGALIYMELATDGRVKPYVVDVTDEKDNSAADKGKIFNDYRNVLRGFSEYKYNDKNEASIPTDKTVDNYYAKHVNEDGVYPLTAELRDILEKITGVLAASDAAIMLPVADYENLWMFACCYYEDYVEPEAIVGEYKFISHEFKEDGKTVTEAVGSSKIIGWDDEKAENIMGVMDDDEYKLVITKRNKFVIYHLENDGVYEEYQSGTWSKNGETFTLVVPDGAFNDNFEFVDIVYSVTLNEEEGALALVGSDNSAWSFKPQITLLTEKEDAKFEMYGDKFRFYQEEEGEGFVQYVYGKQVDGDEENIEVELLDKHSSVKSVELTFAVEGEGEQEKPVLKVKVVYTDNTDKVYVFDMSDVL